MSESSRPAGNYQQHIHVFRGVAIILIVCAHTVPSLDWTAHPLTGRVIDGLANESSIFFFFIAGYLFQHLSARFRFQSYLLQKFKTVILPYLILSVPALIIFTLLVKRVGMWPWFYELETWQQVAMFLLTGKHLAPLWFVPTITLFYLAAPLFLWIDRRWVRGYWLILPLMALSIWLGRDGPNGPLDKAIYLLPMYLLGMLVSHFKAESLELIRRWWLVLVVIAAVSLAGFILGWSQPPHYQVPMKAALALLITLFLWRYHQLFGRRLDYIAEVSFGIFFIHAYLISAIKVGTVYLMSGRVYTGEGSGDIPGTAVSFLLYAGTVLILTVVIIWVAKRLLGKRSRMVVGA